MLRARYQDGDERSSGLEKILYYNLPEWSIIACVYVFLLLLCFIAKHLGPAPSVSWHDHAALFAMFIAFFFAMLFFRAFLVMARDKLYSKLLGSIKNTLCYAIPSLFLILALTSMFNSIFTNVSLMSLGLYVATILSLICSFAVFIAFGKRRLSDDEIAVYKGKYFSWNDVFYHSLFFPEQAVVVPRYLRYSHKFCHDNLVYEIELPITHCGYRGCPDGLDLKKVLFELDLELSRYFEVNIEGSIEKWRDPRKFKKSETFIIRGHDFSWSGEFESLKQINKIVEEGIPKNSLTLIETKTRPSKKEEAV